MKNKAVFLDRDGVINVDKGFVYRIEDFEFIGGAVEAIRLLNENHFKVLVISNQSGIGRGYYTEEDLQRLHRFINGELAKHKAWIDGFYYCPHHPEAEIEEYRIDCSCRKPKPGLLERAGKDFSIDVRRSYLIGDSLRDIEAGRAAGCRTILIVKDPRANEVSSGELEPDWIEASLRSAVVRILKFKSEQAT